jgi:hypothetical protein
MSISKEGRGTYYSCSQKPTDSKNMTKTKSAINKALAWPGPKCDRRPAYWGHECVRGVMGVVELSTILKRDCSGIKQPLGTFCYVLRYFYYSIDENNTELKKGDVLECCRKWSLGL